MGAGVNLYGTQCCGTQEITSLNTHESPEKAMLRFCELTLKKGGSALRYGYSNSAKPLLYSHYTFTAAVYDKECSAFASYERSYPKKIDPEFGQYMPYGAQFAKFIQENKLGEVVTTSPKINKLYHPDHKVQIWIWTPDQDAIEAWYVTKVGPQLAEEAKKALAAAEKKAETAKKEAQAAEDAYEKAMQRIDPSFRLRPEPAAIPPNVPGAGQDLLSKPKRVRMAGVARRRLNKGLQPIAPDLNPWANLNARLDNKLGG